MEKALLRLDPGTTPNLDEVKFSLQFVFKGATQFVFKGATQNEFRGATQNESRRMILAVLDLLDQFRAASEFVCVKVISYMTPATVELGLILLGLACRYLPNPDFYVSISESEAVHVVVYTIMVLSPKVDSVTLNRALGLFLAQGIDQSRPASKRDTSSVKDVLELSNFGPIDLAGDVAIYLDLPVTDPTSAKVRLAIKCHAHRSLAALMACIDDQGRTDKIYEWAACAVDAYNWPAFDRCLSTRGFVIDPDACVTYCLINKIIYLMDVASAHWHDETHHFKQMLHLLCRRGVSFDQNQWLILSKLACDREIMAVYYDQYRNIEIPTSLRDICLKLGIEKAEIIDQLSTLPKSVFLIRNPPREFDHDTVDCVVYQGRFLFTSLNLEGILSSKINPYTGLKIEPEFLDGLLIHRTVARRLGLLKYQYNHEPASQELISSLRSVLCTKAILQTARLFGLSEEDILSLTPNHLFQLLKELKIPLDYLLPHTEQGVILGKSSPTDDDHREEWVTHLSPGQNFGHVLNTFCQIVYDTIHSDLKLAKQFFCCILRIVRQPAVSR